MKYIDSQKLKEELDKVRQEWLDDSNGLEVEGRGAELDAAVCILDSIDDIIDSLQQEQPEADLDREITHIWGKCAAEPKDQIACLHIESFIEIARYFYELGKNSK